jgi:hypothetical protein
VGTDASQVNWLLKHKIVDSNVRLESIEYNSFCHLIDVTSYRLRGRIVKT